MTKTKSDTAPALLQAAGICLADYARAFGADAETHAVLKAIPDALAGAGLTTPASVLAVTDPLVEGDTGEDHWGVARVSALVRLGIEVRCRYYSHIPERLQVMRLKGCIAKAILDTGNEAIKGLLPLHTGSARLILSPKWAQSAAFSREGGEAVLRKTTGAQLLWEHEWGEGGPPAVVFPADLADAVTFGAFHDHFVEKVTGAELFSVQDTGVRVTIKGVSGVSSMEMYSKEVCR